MTNIKWGPAIAVDGKRPAWLAVDQKLQYHHIIDPEGVWCPARHWNWGDEDWHRVTAIRLPADLPTPQADTKPDLAARMEVLVRRVADNKTGDGWATIVEARAIVALLPDPVDPDLIEARRLVAEKWGGGTKSLVGGAVRAGARDESHDVQLALSCIKRGRALALAGEKEA